MRSRILIWALIGFVLLLLGIAIGYYWVREEMPRNVFFEYKKFFSDRIVLYGTDAEGKRFAMKMDLSRKQNSAGDFLHYYSANLYYQGKSVSLYQQFDEGAEVVKARKFLKNYQNQMFPDLSTRETVEFVLEGGGKIFEVRITGLNGDFITKNFLDYTRYLSVGQAMVRLDSAQFQVAAILSKIYTGDFSKYVFFDGYGKLKSVTHQLELFDEAGNFYLVDSSDVPEKSPYYKTHTWLLYKDAAAATMKKSFEATVNFDNKKASLYEWQIGMPEFRGAVLKLTEDFALKKDRSEGGVRGVIVDDDSEREVGGIFSYVVM